MTLSTTGELVGPAVAAKQAVLVVNVITLEHVEAVIGSIEQLTAAVPVPLVLPGSSGVSDLIIREVIAAGIRKVDVGTALNIAFTDNTPLRTFDRRDSAKPQLGAR